MEIWTKVNQVQRKKQARKSGQTFTVYLLDVRSTFQYPILRIVLLKLIFYETEQNQPSSAKNILDFLEEVFFMPKSLRKEIFRRRVDDCMAVLQYPL